MAGFFRFCIDKIHIHKKITFMKNVFMLLGTLVLSAVIIQQIIGVKGAKKITSREDDPTIPPISQSAF
jgi:hypothetical protein